MSICILCLIAMALMLLLTLWKNGISGNISEICSCWNDTLVKKKTSL